MFVLPMDAEGVSVRPLRQISGDAHFNEVFLDDVRLDDDAAVGPVDGGWGVAMTTLMFERVAIGLGGEGFGWRADRFATALIEDEATTRDREVRHRFGAIAAEFLALRFTSYRTLTMLQQRQRPGPRGRAGQGDHGARRDRRRRPDRRRARPGRARGREGRAAGLRHARHQVRGRHGGDPALDGGRAGARAATRAAAGQGRARSPSCGRASAAAAA